jgi:hypothetical protein
MGDAVGVPIEGVLRGRDQARHRGPARLLELDDEVVGPVGVRALDQDVVAHEAQRGGARAPALGDILDPHLAGAGRHVDLVLLDEAVDERLELVAPAAYRHQLVVSAEATPVLVVMIVGEPRGTVLHRVPYQLADELGRVVHPHLVLVLAGSSAYSLTPSM